MRINDVSVFSVINFELYLWSHPIKIFMLLCTTFLFFSAHIKTMTLHKCKYFTFHFKVSGILIIFLSFFPKFSLNIYVLVDVGEAENFQS